MLCRVEVAGQSVLLGRTAAGDAVAVEPICPHHHYTYDAHTGENHYPRRVFPRARAELVQPIRTVPVREDEGWVRVRIAEL